MLLTTVVITLLVVDNLIDRLRQLHAALNKPSPTQVAAAKKHAFVPSNRDKPAAVVDEKDVKFAKRK